MKTSCHSILLAPFSACALVTIALLCGPFAPEAVAQLSTTEKLQDLQSRYDALVSGLISQVQSLPDDPDLFNSLAAKAESAETGELQKLSTELGEARKLIAERETEINKSGLSVDDRNELKAALAAQRKPLDALGVKMDGFRKSLVELKSSKLKSWKEVYETFLSVSGSDKARERLRSQVNEFCKPYAPPPAKSSSVSKPLPATAPSQSAFAQSPAAPGPSPPQTVGAGTYRPSGWMDTVAQKASGFFGTAPPTQRQPPAGSRVIPFNEALRRANQGDAYAQAIVSIYYGTGYLVDRDAAKASDYAIRSAKQRHPLGLYRLGAMLQSGDGVPLNQSEGLRLKEAAFDGLNNMTGDPYALTALAIMVFRGEVVRKDQTEAARLYKIAADAGYAPAQYNYSACLIAGHGVNKNQAQAEAYWRMAYSQAYPLALQGMPR